MIKSAKPVRNYKRKSDDWIELQKRFNLIGISGQTIDSIALLPLLELAIDDGVITNDDRDRLLPVMKTLHLLIAGVDPKLNALWAPFKGRTGFLLVWSVYLRDLSRQLPPEKGRVFKDLIVESCLFMIRVLGGFLKVANLEERVVNAVENAFTDNMVTYHTLN